MTELRKRTILLYGRSGSGKTSLIGELAEFVFKTLKLKTRLYSADKGGVDTIQPYIDLGIIDYVPIEASDPFAFMNRAAKGMVRGAGGKGWVKSDDKMGLYAFEGLRSFAEGMMGTMAAKTRDQNVSIGGSASISFTVTSDGETMKVSGGNQSHYGMAQQRVTEEVWESMKLDAPFILWTSSVSKEDDASAGGKVLGPDVVGKALTTEVPRWYNLSFRVDTIPAQMGQQERHILYMGQHVDVNAGNVPALGNSRRPLDAPPVSLTVEPASLVKALEIADTGYDAALAKIKSRLSL